MSLEISEELQTYAKEKGLIGLTAESLRRMQKGQKNYTVAIGKNFLKFQDRLNKELLQHEVIVDNKFCKWFDKGEMSTAQVKDFVVQFSVFSNLFLIAQLKKMINADTLEGMHASKEILANEIGVIFNSGKTTAKKVTNKDMEGDPDLVATEGTIQGGIFKFRAGHFEWILRMGEVLGLGFNDLGKRKHGTKATLFFCDEMSRIYGHEDYAISQAASYAVENWAAAGFWKQLVNGFQKYKKKNNSDIPLAFFTWHDRVESQHALHTQEEIEEYFFENPSLDQDAFIKWGNEMMVGVNSFWIGLEEQRKKIQ